MIVDNYKDLRKLIGSNVLMIVSDKVEVVGFYPYVEDDGFQPLTGPEKHEIWGECVDIGGYFVPENDEDLVFGKDYIFVTEESEIETARALLKF